MRIRYLAVVATLAAVLPAQAAPPDDPLVAVQRLATTPVTGPSFEVAVVDAAGKPVPDAVLVVVPQRATSAIPARVLELRETWAADPVRRAAAIALAAQGTRCAVDAAGKARLPRVDDTLTATVFAGTAFGQEVLPPKPRDPLAKPTIVVREVRRIAVVVTEPDGSPAAGVPVAIGQPRSTNTMSRCRTGADGRAELLLVATGAARDAAVLALCTTRERLQAPIPADAQPVAFRLPAHGAVVVELRGALPDGARISWRLRSPEDIGSTTPLPARATATTAEFPIVEEGLDLTAEVTVRGIEGSLTAKVPHVAAGAVTRVVIDADSAASRLVLRVLDAAGAPLGGRPLHVHLGTERVYTSRTATTAADGRLDLVVEPPYRAGPLVLECDAAEDTAPGYAEIAFVDLGPGVHQHGDVRLQPMPVLAQGVFVRPDGRPVAGLALQGYGGEWRQTTSDAKGRFTIARRPPLPKECKLLLGSPDWFFARGGSEPLEVTPGATDLRVEVVQAAKLLLHVVEPPDTNS
jgi:hypothetical protein